MEYSFINYLLRTTIYITVILWFGKCARGRHLAIKLNPISTLKEISYD